MRALKWFWGYKVPLFQCAPPSRDVSRVAVSRPLDFDSGTKHKLWDSSIPLYHGKGGNLELACNIGVPLPSADGAIKDER